jgi:hypothetical protein
MKWFGIVDHNFNIVGAMICTCWMRQDILLHQDQNNRDKKYWSGSGGDDGQ